MSTNNPVSIRIVYPFLEVSRGTSGVLAHAYHFQNCEFIEAADDEWGCRTWVCLADMVLLTMTERRQPQTCIKLLKIKSFLSKTN